MAELGSPGTNQRLFATAREYLVGGVNSPVRSFAAVGGTPFFVREGRGALLVDEEGRTYVDFVGSFGPLILGHAHPRVVAAIREQAGRGTTYGTPTRAEVELARKIVAHVPSIEQVRLVNSGTEAAMSALRLARAATGRRRVVKFAGGYHGHVDSLLVQAGSGGLTLGIPDSAGVTPGAAAETLVLPYNDTAAVEEAFRRLGEEIAAVIVEPVAGNMGVVPPADGFLAGLAGVTRRYGALLVFDEVITGFRLGLGGAQAALGVLPDLTLLGKIIGGGLPVGAYGGRRELMGLVAPQGPVYQAGTLSGNPLAMAAGLAQLAELEESDPYPALAARTEELCRWIEEAARRAGVALQVNRVASLFTVFFSEEPVRDWESARRADTGRYARFFRALLARGVYFPPSQFEAAFVSTAHTDDILERSGVAIEQALREVGGS